jgi:transposase, IS5 family
MVYRLLSRWRGLDHFKAYIWSAAVAHNLVLLARLKPA